MTYYLLILAILVWPFGQLLNISLPGLGLTLYPLDLVCGLLTLSLLFSSKKLKIIVQDPLFRPLSIFLLVAALSLLLNLRSAIAGGLAYSTFYLLRLFIYPSVYFSVKLLSGKKVFPYVCFSLFTFSFLGLLQYFFFPDMRFLKLLGFDDHYFRLIGSFYDPNFSGAVFAGVSLVFISLGQWLVALPTIFLLALTFSRASYLVFFLGLVFVFVSKKNWTILFNFLLLAILLVMIPKPFGEGVNLLRTFSIFSRLDSWWDGLSLFVQRPVFGWGYNTLRSIRGERFQIDNSFVFLAATTGLIGLLSFFNLLKNVLFQTKYPPQKLFVFALLTHSLFNNSLFYIWIYFAFWLALGLPSKEYKGS